MIDEINNSLSLIISQTQTNLPCLMKMLALIWGIFFLTKLSGDRLLLLGIRPRRFSGLIGILCAPFLHANFNHIFFNSIPLIVLSDFLLINARPYFLCVSLCIMLISGFLIWCFAKPGLHVGASGLITGYWALLVYDIYQQGSVTAIILGALSLYYFAGIFLGIIPGKKGVSWEGHLFGLIAGVLTAMIKLSF